MKCAGPCGCLHNDIFLLPPVENPVVGDANPLSPGPVRGLECPMAPKKNQGGTCISDLMASDDNRDETLFQMRFIGPLSLAGELDAARSGVCGHCGSVPEPFPSGTRVNIEREGTTICGTVQNVPLLTSTTSAASPDSAAPDTSSPTKYTITLDDGSITKAKFEDLVQTDITLMRTVSFPRVLVQNAANSSAANVCGMLLIGNSPSESMALQLKSALIALKKSLQLASSRFRSLLSSILYGTILAFNCEVSCLYLARHLTDSSVAGMLIAQKEP